MDVEAKAKEGSDGVTAHARPRRFALNFHPPTLIVEFVLSSDTKRKVYHQRIFLKSLSPSSVRQPWRAPLRGVPMPFLRVPRSCEDNGGCVVVLGMQRRCCGWGRAGEKRVADDTCHNPRGSCLCAFGAGD